jgi:uncharacterized protein (DUF427 family)
MATPGVPKSGSYLEDETMSLTMHPGPLASHPPPGNYRIDGPEHRLFWQDFPRRVRAIFAGLTVLDTTGGKLLHETDRLPVLYVPEDDFDQDLLEATDHATTCPFKGVARYWSVRAGDRVAECAVWAYQDPKPEAGWLRGYRAVYWDRMDEWYDESERVEGNLCDPFHRVDVRRSSRKVRVSLGDQVLAETGRPRLLSEAGLPNRLYIPPEDVRRDRLTKSDTRTLCPYKGTATYWSLTDGDRVIDDVAWSYEDPLTDALKVAGYLSFDHRELSIEIS